MLAHWLSWWGNQAIWAAWLEAVGTLLAFFVTFMLLRKERAELAEERRRRRREQASKVSCWVVGGARAPSQIVIDVRYRNGSEEPIYDIRLDIEFQKDGAVLTSVTGALEHPLLPPLETRTETHVTREPQAVMAKRARAAITFVDAAGNRWTRGYDGRLRAIEQRHV